MNSERKKVLIDSIMSRNTKCTECDKEMVRYVFEHEPKRLPLDCPVVAKRADNDKKWVMCHECGYKQTSLRNEMNKDKAALMIDKNSIQKVSIKDMTPDEIRRNLHMRNLAINILLGQYGVPKEVISEVKTTMRSEFHINYYLRHGKFLTEKS